MTKNYIGFGNDYSASMGGLKKAAKDDYNANIAAVKNAATREMLDTIVSMVGFGDSVERIVVNSNPHVLHPLTTWRTDGGSTPLLDAIGDLIEQFKAVPDYKNPDVSFLLMVTTDGDENSSRRYSRSSLAKAIEEVNRDGRWTIVVRVPRGRRGSMRGLGIPEDNIQEWDTTSAGMAQSTAATTAAMDEFYAARSSGKKSSGTFYANTTNVKAKDVKANLVDISAEVSIWPVLNTENGDEIKPFAEKRLGSMPFLKGAAFYQLTKTERKIADTKLILIRDKRTKHVYEGAAARQMIGLPTIGDCRVHAAAFGNFEVFVQSTSINRKLVAGTNVLYWPKVGTGFSAADFPWLNTNQNNVDDTLVAAAAAAIKATAGIAKPKAKKSAPVSSSTSVGVQFFETRGEARRSGKKVHDAGATKPKGCRWYVYK